MKRTTLSRKITTAPAIAAAALAPAGYPHPLLTDTAREHTGETIYEVVARERAERDAGRPGHPCTDFPGCEEVDTHDDHSTPEFAIRSYDKTREPLVWACVGHLSDSQPCVGFNGDDLTPDQAREKAGELRKLADAMEIMADRAHTWQALVNLRKVRETADPGFAEVLTIMEKAIVEDGADPVDVGDRVLELLQQARAERAAEARA